MGKPIVWGLLAAFLPVIIILFLHFCFCFNLEPFAQSGAFGGFIVALYAAYLLYKTLNTQKETLEEQKHTFEIESFENKFFNLLKTQREIADELKIYFTFSDEKDLKERSKTIVGREVFIYSKSELTKIWETMISNKYFGRFDEESAKITLIQIQELLESDLDQFLKAEKEKYWKLFEKNRLINKAYNITEEKWNDIKKNDDRERIVFLSNCFFTKYSYAFDHYYRHLFLILNFVNHFESESKGKKKNYIDFVEAQMSPLELALLFYYSASNPEIPKLLNKYSFLEHLTDRDLIDPSHRKVQF